MNDFNKIKDSSSLMNWHTSRILESGLFILIIVIEACIFIYLTQGKYIVGGHDGFQYFSLQYIILDHLIIHGEIPQWTPYLTHGFLANVAYITTSGIFQNVLLLTGDLFKNVNFLPLFYTGIFIDELLLLTGVWLLGRRFFASPLTVFFVTLSVMGSCIWVLQPWWNFHIYYAIPLILYFIHVFIDSGKWRYYFLAGNLLFMQCLGNLPYFLPVISLVIFLYFIFYFSFNFEDTLKKIKALRFGWSFVLTTSIILFLFVALITSITIGMNQTINYNPLRNTDGTTTLAGFLTYGQIFTWRAWLELILRVSPFMDSTLYIGLLCVPFIFLGLILNCTKQNLHFLLMIIVLLLFSMGTFVSVFFYYTWPMMKYFRHISLVTPIVKVFLCFLAGFGFDAVFFNKSRWKNPLTIKAAAALCSLFMLGISFWLFILSHHYDLCIQLIKNMAPAETETLPFFTNIFNENIIIPMLNHATLFALTGSVLFAFLPFIKRKKYFLLLALLMSTVHFADVYGFKFSDIKFKTISLNNELSKIIDFQPITYSKRRDISFENNNPRAELLKVLPVKEPGVLYSSTHNFLFKDEAGNKFRNELWLRPFDKYVRIYWGQFGNDLSVKPNALLFGSRLEFPQSHPAALKISGVTEDKIQFFSEADFISSDDEIASKITDATYKGDKIFLSSGTDTGADDSSKFSKDDLSSSKRLQLPYRISRFDADNINIIIDTGSRKSAWLLYSDVWHPLWRATVNGKETPVYKANLAYKTVKLESGLNKVHLYFKSRLMSFLYFIFGLNALYWLAFIIYTTGKIISTHHRDAYYRPEK
jgi:hypothetical protein